MSTTVPLYLVLSTSQNQPRLAYGEVRINDAADFNTNFQVGLAAFDGDSNPYYTDQAGNLAPAGGIGATGSGFSTGSTVQFCLDTLAGNLWIGVDDVYPGGGNPQAGISPTYSGLSGNYFIYVQIDGRNTRGKATLQARDAAFTRTRPARFGSWSGL